MLVDISCDTAIFDLDDTLVDLFELHLRGVRGTKACSMKVMAVLTDTHTSEEINLERPDYVFKSVKDVSEEAIKSLFPLK